MRLGSLSLSSGGLWTVGGASILWGVDFRSATDGALATLPGGLTLARASSATVAAGATVVTAGITNDVARIGYHGDDEGDRGLLLELGTINLLSPNSRAIDSFGTAGSSVVITPDEIAGPDGSSLADLVDVASGGYSRYQSLGFTAAKYAVSIWLKNYSGGSGAYQTNTFGATAHPNAGTLVGDGWQRVSYVFLQDSAVGGYIPLDARNNGIGGWPQAIKVYVDLMQVELGAYERSYIGGTRQPERLYLASRTPLVRGGRLRLRVREVMRFGSADMGSARRLWTIDANNYVAIDTSRNVTAVVGGTSVALPTAIPAWSAFDILDLRVDVGNGAPTGRASVNDGAVTSLGTGAGSHAALSSSGAIDLLCNGTASVLEGWVQVIQALAA